MGLLWTSIYDEQPFPWPIWLALDILAFYRRGIEQADIYDAVFAPYDQGVNMIELDIMSVAQLQTFLTILQNYRAAKRPQPLDTEQHIIKAECLIQEVIQSKCPH